jgi:hypothetical protein
LDATCTILFFWIYDFHFRVLHSYTRYAIPPLNVLKRQCFHNFTIKHVIRRNISIFPSGAAVYSVEFSCGKNNLLVAEAAQNHLDMEKEISKCRKFWISPKVYIDAKHDNGSPQRHSNVNLPCHI